MRVYGFCVGILATLMGVGGGLFSNLLMTFYGRPIHQAVATSSALAVLISIPGALGYVYAGWPAAARFPDVAALQMPFTFGYVSLIGALAGDADQPVDRAARRARRACDVEAHAGSRVRLLSFHRRQPVCDKPLERAIITLRGRMRRREFIGVLGGLAAGLPLAAARSAERAKRLGVLMSTREGDPVAVTRVAKFREGLAQLGWREGQNLQIEWRWSGGDIVLTRLYAEQLVQLAPDVLLGNGTPATVALKQATIDDPDRVFGGQRSRVAGHHIKHGPSRRQHHRLFLSRIFDGRQIAGDAETDRAANTSVAIMFNPETYPYYAIHLKSFEAVAKQAVARADAGAGAKTWPRSTRPSRNWASSPAARCW